MPRTTPRREAPASPLTLLARPLAAVLTHLNALGFLDDVAGRSPSALLCFGPKTIIGLQPALWTGGVLWTRPRGYYEYRVITLLGVWAVQAEAEHTRIIVGTRRLHFCAPSYTPESYFHFIRREFEMYYGKDAPPPIPECQLYSALYRPGDRLAMRAAIENALRGWMSQQRGAEE